jgi:HEAT repeat protein
MAGSKPRRGVDDLPRIQLKYPGLDAFARATRKTFKIGRMSLKSKKIFKAGTRLVLSFIIKDLDEPIKIIGQIIDVVPPKEGTSAMYGIKFLNFTEKKLQKLEKAQAEPTQAPKKKKPPPKPTEPEAPPPPEPEAAPAPEPEEPPAPAPEEPELPAPEPQPEAQDEETEVYTIEANGETTHMSFDTSPLEQEEPEPDLSFEQPPEEEEEPKEVLVPDAPEQESIEEPEEEEEPELPPPDEAEAPATEEAIPAEPPWPDEEEEELPPEPEEEEDELPLPEEEEEPELEGVEPTPEPLDDGEEDLPSLEEPEEEEITLQSEQEEDAPEPLEELPSPEEVTAPEEFPESDFMESAESEPVGLEPMPEPEELEEEPEPMPSDEPGEEPEPMPAEKDEAGAPVPAKASAPEPEPEPEKKPRAPVLKPMSPAEYQALSDFMLKFTRALMQSTAANGQEGGRGLKPLYDEFKNIMAGRDQIGIFLRSSATGKDFLLEGTDIEQKSIKGVFPKGVATDVVIKLADLFERKGLIGMTLGRYSTYDAFENFVSLLGGFTYPKDSVNDLVRSLIQSGVYHLNPVFVRDQIPETDTINWRVSMMLGRLAGEMRRLIIMADAIQEDPRALFTLRVEDAVKPIKNPELLAELLLSCNLAMSGQKEFTEADLQDEIIFAIPIGLLVKTCDIMAVSFEDVFSKVKSAPDDDRLKLREETLRKTLRRAMARVSFEAHDSGMKMLRDLYSHKVLSYDELPDVLRGRIDGERAAEDFLKNPKFELDAFEKEMRSSEYNKKAKQMGYVLMELLRRGKTNYSDLAFKALVNHRTQKTPPFPERPRLAKEAMDSFGDEDSINLILEKFLSGSKEEKGLAASLFYSAGEKSVPALSKVLEESEDRSIRRLVCDILIRIGDKIGHKLVERMNAKDIPWYLVRNLLMVLGEMESQILMDDIDRFINHDHPRVREESLGYLIKASKPDEASSDNLEPKLVRVLRDPDLNVRKKAVQSLGQLRDLSDFSLQGLIWMIEKKVETIPSKEEELLFIQVAEALGKVKNRRLPEGRTLEDALIKILESESKGLLGRMVGGKGRTPRMRSSLIDVLGKIGTEKSLKVLAQASKDKDLKKAAKVAIAAIKKQ